MFHIETIQLICNEHQLTGFYMEQGFTETCFWRDCALKNASFVEQYQMNYLTQVFFWKIIYNLWQNTIEKVLAKNCCHAIKGSL